MKKLIFLFAAIIFMTANSVYSSSSKSEQAAVKEATLAVEGSCGMCKTKIEKTAKGINGVSKAEWDKKTKVLSVTYDNGKTSLDNISKAIAKIGYDTEKYKADNKAYDALAGCCKYRK